MAGVGCGKCGASIDPTSRFCPSCGNATSGYGANLIGLEPVDATATGSGSGEEVSKRAARRAKKGESRSWIALALAAVVLLGGLTLLDRGSSTADDASAEEATAAEEARAEEAAAAAEDEPAADRSTTSTTARATSSTTDGAGRSITTDLSSPDADGEREPSFTDGAEPWGSDVDLAFGVNGTLYLAALDSTIWSVDLATGQWNEPLDMGRGTTGSGRIDVRGNNILITRRTSSSGISVSIYRIDRPDEPSSRLVAGDWLIPSNRDDEVVMMRFSDEPPFGRSYQAVDLAGAERWVRSPPVSDLAVGAADGALLLRWLGKTILHEEGDARIVADGPPRSFDGEVLIWERCQFDLSCVAVAGTVEDSELLTFPDADLSRTNRFGELAVDLDAGILVMLSIVLPSGNSTSRLSIEVHRESGLANTSDLPLRSASGSDLNSVKVVPGSEWIVSTAGSQVEFWNWATDERRTIVAPIAITGIDIARG